MKLLFFWAHMKYLFCKITYKYLGSQKSYWLTTKQGCLVISGRETCNALWRLAKRRTGSFLKGDCLSSVCWAETNSVGILQLLGILTPSSFNWYYVCAVVANYWNYIVYVITCIYLSLVEILSSKSHKCETNRVIAKNSISIKITIQMLLCRLNDCCQSSIQRPWAYVDLHRITWIHHSTIHYAILPY